MISVNEVNEVLDGFITCREKLVIRRNEIDKEIKDLDNTITDLKNMKEKGVK